MEIYQVDAFTDQVFKGNPAAVCILSRLKKDNWLQNVASEMNLSETAYLYKKGPRYQLRWFTPEHEEELCGHATLASAHVLWETERVEENQEIKFNTRSGVLIARKKGPWINLDFPLEAEEKSDLPDNILNSLGIKPKYIGKNRLDYLVEVESEEIVRNISPDFNSLKELDARGIIITSKSNSDKYDFISRFFAPEIGIEEDPVTGSAHCCLGPYWQKKLDKDELIAYQASERGGTVKVEVGQERVSLGGKAITVFEGELLT